MNENISTYGTIHERIKYLVEELAEGKNTVFAQKLGISEANVRGYIKGVVPKTDALEKIVRNYDISADWLLTGRGSMLADERTAPAVSYDPAIGSPYYDVDFIGGFDEVFNSQVSVPSTNIIIRGFEKAQMWCNVTGHSMEPKINHGDIIGLHECRVEDIQFGEIYAVVLDTLRTIKILRKSADPLALRYVPINTADYDEQDFPISRIIKIYEVIGSVKKFF